MGDRLPPTDYTGKDKKILRKTIGSLISIIDNPDLAFKITYKSCVGFEVRLSLFVNYYYNTMNYFRMCHIWLMN
jgi:hypothetical protein